ncbi:hypothetical protein TrVE_jg1152 [Triparma verrucosa]|uniref:Uncharacterized protein n=1 Tax=Triparma verrucosa TaxID=1606542 RepID=A0A9W7CGJ8_9STRA|nr:hypothetical protein TrVE_jg1152 [Triparma verrucosa]
MIEETSLRFEDLSIDDTLEPLPRFLLYSTSQIALQRLVHVKQLSDITLGVEYEDLNEVLEVVKKLETDEEYVVRQHLAEQVVKVGLFALVKAALAAETFTPPEPPPVPLTPAYIEALLASGIKMDLHTLQPYRPLILETCVPLLGRMLSDSSPEVRASASESLTMLPPHIAPPDLGQHILTLILSLSHSDDNEELRMTGCGLLGKMAKGVGRDLCRQFVVPEVVSLAEDPVFRVRKSAALNLASICEVAGEEDTKGRLLPAYIRLTKDDMYRVRKACAESIVQVSNVLPAETRKDLVPLFQSLLDDSSKFVRHAALCQLGRFIASLADSTEPIPSSLIEKFIEMSSVNTADDSTDAELHHACAFSFPAVVLAVSKTDGGWEMLKQCFNELCESKDFAVRRTLSHSLHCLAGILPPETVKDDLLHVFEQFLRDEENVRVGVLKGIAKFLKVLEPGMRESYLHTLTEIFETGSPLNWRMRHIVALQLPSLILLFPAASIRTSLLPLIINLISDAVCEVRIAAFHAVGSLLAKDDKKITSEIAKQLSTLASATTYCDRVSFLSVCTVLIGRDGWDEEHPLEIPSPTTESSSPPASLEDQTKSRIEKMYSFLVSSKLLPSAVKLKNDRTSNVRVKCLVFFRALPSDLLSKSKEALAALEELEKDDFVMKTLNKVILYPIKEKKNEEDKDKEEGGGGRVEEEEKIQDEEEDGKDKATEEETPPPVETT